MVDICRKCAVKNRLKLKQTQIWWKFKKCYQCQELKEVTKLGSYIHTKMKWTDYLIPPQNSDKD